jgi:gliding motility-associated-like protein
MLKYRCILFGVLALIQFKLISQKCAGNLGENIFIDGDFGTGTSNILQIDPMIAPGYTYATQGPPNDGYYVITNNSDWPRLFQSWIKIKDNSTDPNGYMMVVNASFTPGLFYEKTITGLCENTLYEFSADVINMIQRNVTNHILPNVTFLIDDIEKYNTGAIPQSEQWNTAGFTFTTKPGQFQLKLSLKNNAPGGIGNDIGLDNISFRACGPKALILPESVANICENGEPISLKVTIEGDQFKNPAIQWQVSDNGVSGWRNLTKDSVQKHSDLHSGFYFYRYLLAATEQNLANTKCRLISNVKTIFVQAKFYTIHDTVCSGTPYKFGKRVLTSAGTYIDTLVSRLGCDSIVTMHLSIVPDRSLSPVLNVKGPTCLGKKDGSILVQSVVSGYPPFNITIDNKPIPSNQLLNQLSKGSYNLQILDHFHCSYTEKIDIIDPPEFRVDLGPDKVLNLGSEINLKANATGTIIKSSYIYDDMVICSLSCEGSFFVPHATSKLIVESLNANDCKALDTITVQVNETINLFIPNVFTPNGDGKNDVFLPYTTKRAVKEIRSFKIFNRYGGLVFASFNHSPLDLAGWDGTILLKNANAGTYVYLVELVLINDKVVRKSGDITLIR